ncbi:MAG: CRISPR-associated helicase Cas3' [Thermoproteota archaeon]
MRFSLPLLYYKLKKRGFFGEYKDRPLLDEILGIIEQAVSKTPSLTFVQLPPGYGKTAIPFSISLWSILNEETPIEHSIHVLPLRAIVEDVEARFTGYGREVEGKSIGLKALGVSKEDAENIAGAQCMFISGSPFFQKEGFISTTLDTFALLACKLPTSEVSKIADDKCELYGHYEIARGAILSSVVVFDEAHLFFEEREENGKLKRAAETLIALMVALLEWRVPIVMMTATLPNSIREEIIKNIREYVPETEFNIFEYGQGNRVDRDFENEVLSTDLKTKLENDEDRYVNLICQAYDSYNRVLVVVNTIPRSIDLFNKLKNKGIEPILLHSKFTEKDRKNKLERLKKDNRWLCITTQVIEAGVDISSDILFTDIAPICSIIQRAGRCCRPSHTYLKAGEVIINVSKESKNAAEKVYDKNKVESTYRELTNISKSFCWHSYQDYFPLIKKIYDGRTRLELGYLFITIRNIFEDPYNESHEALDYLLELGSFTRDSLLIPAIVSEKGEIKSLEDLRNKSSLFIPIEDDDLKTICKKYDREALFIGKEKKIEEKFVSEEIIKNKKKLTLEVISGRIRAFRIPKEIYDEECGLKLWV